MPYHRVIPRDLFNESKLLKCLGQLSLLLHDYPDRWPLTLEHDDPESGFMIEQDPSSGSIYCPNLMLMLDGEREIILTSPLNSREPYPLQFSDDQTIGNVFTVAGHFSPEFLEFIGGDADRYWNSVAGPLRREMGFSVPPPDQLAKELESLDES